MPEVMPTDTITAIRHAGTPSITGMLKVAGTRYTVATITTAAITDTDTTAKLG